jgi:hypothetical protein
MGDEELNFTEEEAQCWATDSRNQAQKGAGLTGIVIGCILFLVAVVAMMVGGTSAGSTSDGGQIHVGVLLAR